MNFIVVPPKVHIGRVIRDAIIFDFKNWQGKTFEPLIQELAHHLSEADLAEVQQILVDIEERIQRFSRGLDKSS